MNTPCHLVFANIYYKSIKDRLGLKNEIENNSKKRYSPIVEFQLKFQAMNKDSASSNSLEDGKVWKSVDTHCHLSLCKHMPVAEHVQKIREAGISFVLDPGLDPSDIAQRAEQLAGFKEVLLGGAVAPHYIQESSREDLQAKLELLEDYAAQKKIHAIAEIGLDITENSPPLALQEWLLKEQLHIAERHGLPAALHLRTRQPSHENKEARLSPNAYVLAAKMLAKLALSVPVISHCFSGTKEDADALLQAGAYLSFSGMVTFTKNKALQAIAASMPLEKMLLETDAPFLAPQPVRGKPNSSPFILHTLSFIQKLRPEDDVLISQQLYKNSCLALKIMA